MTIIVRRLQFDDAASFRSVRLHGLLHDPTVFGGCYAEESLLTDRDFAHRIGEPPNPSAIFGAFLADESLVAIVGLYVPTALQMRHKAMLWGMYALPSARGLGCGRALMQHLLDYARSLPAIERILLAVTVSNVVASAWYEAVGFHLYGIERCAVKFGCDYEDDELRVLELHYREQDSDACTVSSQSWGSEK